MVIGDIFEAIAWEASSRSKRKSAGENGLGTSLVCGECSFTLGGKENATLIITEQGILTPLNQECII